jgi:hypothetical protein
MEGGYITLNQSGTLELLHTSAAADIEAALTAGVAAGSFGSLQCTGQEGFRDGDIN